jgi:serine/threonine protein kinase
MEASHQSGTLIVHRYRILTRVGEGGFGTVYKARDQQHRGKIVAIKEINMVALSAQEKIEVTDTFNREITLLSDLKHKNLPRISNQFTDPEHWYIVMDYIEGQTLEELLTRSSKGRFSVSEVIKIGIALCDVLAYLHDQKPSIIFRDVKPGNIMYTPWDHLYLIDFGIARRYRPGQAHDTGSLGSPGYAAPEQYGRAQTTLQTDIYGLGATLQTLLTGKEPLEIRLQGLPSDVHIPWKLQALFLQMMDQDPTRRPRTMAEVKKALMGFNTTTTFSLPRLAFPFFYFGFMALNQSGFYSSPFMEPYLVLIPLSFIGYCSVVYVRFWRALPGGPSVKAVVFLAKKQLNPFLFVLVLFTDCISLLYALLVHPYMTTQHAIFLWCNGAFIILALLIFFMVWLKKRQQRRTFNHNTVQMQMPAPLQQQKRNTIPKVVER